MPSFDVAHIREQGVDLILVPVNSSFGHKPESEQIEIIEILEIKSHEAGLAGSVVPLWRTGNRMTFIAPTPWHSFFKSISYDDVLASINKTISW